MIDAMNNISFLILLQYRWYRAVHETVKNLSSTFSFHASRTIRHRISFQTYHYFDFPSKNMFKENAATIFCVRRRLRSKSKLSNRATKRIVCRFPYRYARLVQSVESDNEIETETEEDHDLAGD